MNVNKIVHQLRQQIHQFSASLTKNLSKPKARFVQQMIYGLQASKDVKLSEIGRAIEEDISLKKTVERLSHHLQEESLREHLQHAIMGQAARRVQRDTLLIIDPSDIQKPYAEKMPYLATVRDGSTGELVDGYWTGHIIACQPGSRRMVPLHQTLWSSKAPDFDSENTQILQAVDEVLHHVGTRGIWVMDRGGDRCKLLGPFLERAMRFIIRLRGDRDLMYRGQRIRCDLLAKRCPVWYIDSVQRVVHGQEVTHRLEYGFVRVRLPRRDERLFLVVVRGFGQEPLLLLTNVELRKSRNSVWAVVEGYLCRWLVEETIRFIKQAYHLEDLRLLNYTRLRTMMVLVLLAVYFAAVHLGEGLKLDVLTRRVISLSKRLFAIPEFHYYALADGIAFLLSKSSKGPIDTPTLSPPPDLQHYLFTIN